jgi:hypothetical protein
MPGHCLPVSAIGTLQEERFQSIARGEVFAHLNGGDIRENPIFAILARQPQQNLI